MLDIINYDYEIKPLGKNAGALLKEVVKKLNKRMTAPYWISAGTALGLYRDGDFIKGDTDIDLAMVGYYGVDKTIKEIFRKNWWGGYKVIREVWDGDRVMQIAFMKNDTIIDFYFHYLNGENLENHGESGWTRMKADICLKPKWIRMKYGTLPIPQEEYFVIRYGADWQIPQDKKPIFYEV